MKNPSVIFLRHGRTAYNAAMRLQGRTDIPLDEVGQWQAKLGGTALASVIKPTLVVSSDLVRAAKTAQAFADAADLEVVLDERLQERSFGVWEGLTREEIEAKWPREFEAWRGGAEPQNLGAESKKAVGQRVVQAVNEHLKRAIAIKPEGAVLVVVSHGAAINAGITTMIGQDPGIWRGLQGLHNVHWSHLVPSGAGTVETNIEKTKWLVAAHNIGAGFPLEHWNNGPDWNLEPTSE